jgi:hypothetical protein
MAADDTLERSPPAPAPARPVARPGRRRLLVGVVVLVLAAGVGLACWRVWWPGPPVVEATTDDPRLRYAGPLRNVRPDVAYVGDAECAACHADVSESYRRHPMANTLLPVAEVIPLEDDGPGRHNPFPAFGSLFRVEIDRRRKRARHVETRADAAGRPVFEFVSEVHYAIGSGNHGRSYLSDRGGYLFQTPISWFSQKRIWDTSPGFKEVSVPGRPIPPTCLFCHANEARSDPDGVNHFPTPAFTHGHAIGCERCHGPGDLHAQTADRLDIVNPSRLEWPLREAVCEQCHLEALARAVRRGRGLYDFRPGLPLEDFWAVYVAAREGAEGQKAVSHVEQMYQSRCFRDSGPPAKLGCVSCHDPHVKVGPAERVAFYRGRCLTCHPSVRRPADGEHGCSLPLATRLRQRPDDSCIDCHMPRFASADIAHTASTDHRVPRRPGAPPAGPGPAPVTADLPVASFYGDRLPAGDPEAARDLGVVLVQLGTEGKAPGATAARRAIPLLDAALRRHPDDLAALQARADALLLQTRLQEALAGYEAVLARAPRRELALRAAASAAQDLRQTDQALGYWRRAAEANPWMPLYRSHLTPLLAEAGDWDGAGEHARAWVRLDPGSVEARRLWVRCLLHEGKKEEARAEFARIEALAPAERSDLRRWFAEQTR